MTVPRNRLNTPTEPDGHVAPPQPGEPGLGPGIEMVAELGRGSHASVYRIRRHGVDYALKVLHRPVDLALDDRSFAREASLLARVDHPGVPRVFDVGTSGVRPYLVLEFVEGRPLSDLLRSGTLDEPALVRVAGDVAAALAAAHRAGLVHRDINPANIMIRPSGRACLIDFGLAATGRVDPGGDSVVGTFEYSAPEQTGVLARPVDHRADLYSLGAVLFQCATGVVPYRSDDVGELMVMHASAPVPDPRAARPALSAGLAEVIRRLLAKDPDDRFAGAEELHAALRRVAPGELGEDLGDRSAAADAAVVGRDAERALLAARWRRALDGEGGVALVSGASGVGKSSLALAVAAAARADGALVLSGKCDADSALPLAPLRTAVEGYLRSVTGLPDDARAAAVRRLRAAAGAGAGLLRTLSPTLSVLLDAPPLAIDDHHEQFATAVASFLAALVSERGGLLLLDDVQWLDATSRAVLRRLAAESADVRLLVVATARDDGASVAGCRAFEADAGPALDLRVPLTPLSGDETGRLVAAYLTGSSVGPEVTAELAARGRGNPFTILEYLRALIDAGALRPCWGTWRLDARVLQSIGLPGEVLDLVLARIEGLGAASRRVLTVGAAIGNTVDTALLAAVLGDDPTPALVEAAGRGLLHGARDGYTFVHDRIREALLSSVGPELPALHQRIAEVLDAQGRTDAPGVYATARHYAMGEAGRTPERVYATGRAAGQLALDENAPDAAVTFLRRAADAAAVAGITPDSRFREALGTAYWLTGRLAPAREQLETGLAAEADPVRRAALYLQLAHVLRTGWELTAAIACVRRGLAELGEPVPRNPVLFGLATAGTMVHWLARGSRPPSARPVTGAEATRLRLHTLLCRAASASAALNLQHALLVAFNLRSVRSAYRLGRTVEYVSHLSGVGAIAGSMRLRKRRDLIFRRALGIARDLGDPKAYANAVWFEAFSKVLGGEIGVEEWNEASAAQGRWLEVDFYTNILLMRCRDLLQRGYAAEAMTWHDLGRRRIAGAAEESFPGFSVLASMVEALLGGTTKAPAELSARAAEPLDAGHGIQFILGAVQTALEQDELAEEFEAAIEGFDRLGVPVSAIFPEYRMIYAYIAFGRITQLQRAGAAERTGRLARARHAVRRLKRAAHTSGASAAGDSLRLLQGYHLVADAALWQLRGQQDKALDLLAGGERLLVRLDAPLVEYEANRVRARALAALGRQATATRHAEAALALAVEHGWARRARWIHREFGAMDPGRPAGRARGYLEQHRMHDDDPYRRRLAALQQVSTAAAKVLDPRQLARVALDEVLRILGAERAVLFLAEEDGTLRPDVGRDAGGQDVGELSGYATTLVDRVAAERYPIVVTGSEEGAALGSRSAVVYGLRSIMVAPLELEGRLVGVVYLDSRVAKGVFTDADVAILTAVTSHIAVSLETARAAQLELAVQAAREQRDTAEVLRAAMSELAVILDPREVLQRLVAIVGRTVRADRTCLVQLDGAELIVAGDAPPGADLRRLLTLRAARRDPAGAVPPEVRAVLGEVTDWIAVPVATRSQGHGVLVAGAAAGTFTQAHRDIVAAMVGQGATAYDNACLFAQVQRMATTDDLTGVSNRRHFTELARRLILQAVRHHRPLAALMLDVDHFKRINDSFGHGTGDDVIRAVARLLQSHLRGPDVLGRYGGEEFALVLGEMHGDPVAVAERLRVAVERLEVPGPGRSVRVTVSVGVAELKPDDDLGTLLARADEALYRAKQAGRNRVRAG